MELLSIIPRFLGVALLGLIAAILTIALYLAAYTFPVAGLLIAAGGVVALDPINIIIGLLLAGYGGLCYIEWFAEGEVPTITQIGKRLMETCRNAK